MRLEESEREREREKKILNAQKVVYASGIHDDKFFISCWVFGLYCILVDEQQ